MTRIEDFTSVKSPTQCLVQSGFKEIEATITVESLHCLQERKMGIVQWTTLIRSPSLPDPGSCVLSHKRVLGLFSLLIVSELEVAPVARAEASFGLFIVNGETESQQGEGTYCRSCIFPSGTQIQVLSFFQIAISLLT